MIIEQEENVCHVMPTARNIEQHERKRWCIIVIMGNNISMHEFVYSGACLYFYVVLYYALYGGRSFVPLCIPSDRKFKNIKNFTDNESIRMRWAELKNNVE